MIIKHNNVLSSLLMYAPNVSILDYKTGYFIAQQGEGENSPGEELCYFTEDSYNAFTSGEACDCITLTIRFKENTPGTPNYRWFCTGFSQLYFVSDNGDKTFDFYMPINPTYITSVKADKNSIVEITLYFMCQKTDENSPDGILSLIRDTNVVLALYDMHLCRDITEARFDIVGDVDFSQADAETSKYLPADSWEMENVQKAYSEEYL